MNIRHSAGMLTALSALPFLAFAPRAAHADLVMTTTPSSTAQGGAGALDVILTNTGPSATNIASFSFEVAVPSLSGITFTNADISTTSPYIFAGNSLFGPDIATSSPGSLLDASDLSTTSGTTVGAGTTYGLGYVTYTVAPGAMLGPVTVSFDDIGGLTSLSDADGDPVSFTATPGTITITPSGTPTPEPAPITAFAIFALGLGGLLARARRKSAGA